MMEGTIGEVGGVNAHIVCAQKVRTALRKKKHGKGGGEIKVSQVSKQ